MGGSSMGGMSGGSKFQGFGSEDLAKYSGGYDLSSTKNSGYDPYKRKGGSVFEAAKAKEKKEKEKEKEKTKEKSKKKSKKQKKKKKSESEDDSDEDSDDSDKSSEEESDEESSEEEKPKKKSKAAGISKPKTKHSEGSKQVTQAPKQPPKVEAKKQDPNDLFDLLDTNDTPAPQPTGASSGLDNLGLDFGQPVSTQQHQAQSTSGMFQNMSVASSQPNDMFANMYVSSSSTPQTQNTQAASWSQWGASQSQQPGNSSVSNITNTLNLFGNMNISQPVSQSKNDSHATASFNLFEGMSHSSSHAAPQPIHSHRTPLQSTPSDDFGDFQDSNAAQQKPVKSKTDDAWAMGGKLFNLSGLKKDSERQDKLASGHKHSPEKNVLSFNKGEDLNTLWSHALGEQTTGHGASHGSGMSTGGSGYGQSNFGFGGSSFPTSGQQNNNYGGNSSGFSSGFGQNNQSYGGGYGQTSQPTGGFGQSNQSSGGFGQSNQSYGGGFGSFGFPNSQPQQNFSSGTSGSTGFPSSSGFPSHPNQGFNNWQSNQSSGFGSGGFPSSSNSQSNQNPFF